MTTVATAYVLAALAIPISLVLGFVAVLVAERGRRRLGWALGLTALALPLVGWLVQELWWAGVL